MQIRLWKWQIDRLNAERGCSGAAVIRHAVKRYNRGDFAKCENVVQNNDLETSGEKVPQKWQLQGYSIKHRFDIPDSVMRNILAWHWLLPDEVLRAECSKEIKRLDNEINEMFKAYTGVPYIQEDYQ